MSPDDLLSIPLIWTPGQEEEEVKHETRLMLERALIAQQVLSGALGVESYLDMLSSQGYYAEDLIARFGE